MVLDSQGIIKVHSIIADLKALDVDGELMQFIIEKVGMREQMLRQFALSSDISELEILMEEKRDLEFDDKLWDKINNNLGLK